MSATKRPVPTKGLAPLNREASQRRSEQIERRIKTSRENQNSRVKIK